MEPNYRLYLSRTQKGRSNKLSAMGGGVIWDYILLTARVLGSSEVKKMEHVQEEGWLRRVRELKKSWMSIPKILQAHGRERM